MQGTVFGSLICTSVVDKLAKIFYGNQNILYQYKIEINIPPLGMVDDVLCVSTCSNMTVSSNATMQCIHGTIQIEAVLNKMWPNAQRNKMHELSIFKGP